LDTLAFIQVCRSALGNPLDKLPHREVNCPRWFPGCLPLFTVDDVLFFFHEPVGYRLDGKGTSTFKILWVARVLNHAYIQEFVI